ncbi:MAG: T9SS type A sorting domain-containing protein [Candidatus Marinimicrobia bacterium]|nr:T9SS type A sorting domain-containing protein [Candidatus Neomarinimicrobiota bacterium]
MKKIITIVTIVALLFAVGLVAKPLDGQPLAKTTATSAGQVTRTLSNISNWAYWVYSNGKTGITPNDVSGGFYPRGTAGAIYQDGFVWGGKYDTDGDNIGDAIRVGGQTYNIGTQPGRVITGGKYEDNAWEIADKTDPSVRVYRIRPDYPYLSHAMLVQDAAEQREISPSAVTEAMTQEIKDQYALDWEEWPVDWGAPYYDRDDDDVYTAGVDEPGIAQADQVIWYVVNDYNATATTALYGSQPIGIELQTTIWAYNQPSARLGQIIFRSNKLINKSGTTLTDMYVSMWADPDLGESGNDLVGCDILLSLGYAYNGEATDGDYDAFNLAPPSFGFDFFQGPMVPSVGDTAIYELDYVYDHRNLEMTSFGWFAANSAVDDPLLGDYVGTLQFYNLIRGYVPTEDVDNPSEWHLGNVSSNPATKFPMSGDPVAGTGDLDAHDSYQSPGDRRMALSSGPFTFGPGEAQEVVVAIIGGLGADNLGSVADLKLTDDVAQKLFTDLFQTVPKPPTSPSVSIRPLENTVVLEWGSDPDRVFAVEDTIISGYEFEGYNVYQLPHATATKDQAVRIATFDKVNLIKTLYGTRNLNAYEGKAVDVPIAYGSDSGIERYIEIDWDYIDGKPLYEGKTYYFAVTAYNQNQDEGRLSEAAQESAIIPLGVTLQEAKPGTAYEWLPSEGALEITHETGISSGMVDIVVVDPTAVTGHDYTVNFVYSPDSSEIYWRLTDNDLSVIVLDGCSQMNSLDDKEPSMIVDGLGIRVSGPSEGGIDAGKYGVYYGEGSETSLYYLAGWDFTGERWITGVDWGGRYMFGGLDVGAEFFGSSLTDPTDYCDVTIEWAGLGDAWPDSAALAADSTLKYARDLADASMTLTPARWSKAVVQRRDESYAKKDTLADVPFAVYNTETTPPTRLKICIVEDENAGSGNYLWDMGWSTDAEWSDLGGREYIFILNDNYYEADGTTIDYSDYLSTGTLDGTYDNSMYAIWPDWRSASRYYLDDEWEMEIYASHINVPGTDVFTFKAPALLEVNFDVEKINVYPNPYYAYNEQATSAYDQYVTFTHLPETATIKIFNLAGVLVKTLDHTADNGQFHKWDLTNESDIPVASGMYLAHINVPDEGVQKVLKVMIVQKKQILEYY